MYAKLFPGFLPNECVFINEGQIFHGKILKVKGAAEPFPDNLLRVRFVDNLMRLRYIKPIEFLDSLYDQIRFRCSPFPGVFLIIKYLCGEETENKTKKRGLLWLITCGPLIGNYCFA